MPRTIHRPAIQARSIRRVSPSVVDPATAERFTLEQELKPFGAWVGDPIWVPPKDSSKALAETMLRESRPFASKDKRWTSVVKKHRSDFTQVREFDLYQPSIRLPKGRFFVTVTEQEHFDEIADPIPNCVQTRLEEFLSGPAKKRGAKVYYVKPLSIEIGDELILTTREDLTAAIAKIQEEVFAEYRRLALYRRPLQAMVAAANLGLAIPRAVVNYVVGRKQKAIDALQAHLEFKRRKLALSAARAFRKHRTDVCTFDDMLELTNPLKRTDVIDQYCTEQQLSRAKRAQLLRMAAGTVPWFVALSLTVSYVSTLALIVTTPPIVVCDPAFVAEMPGSSGEVLKIGHFDEVGGITHVEI
ncbi:MAG: hypothetical protein HYX69_08885 [Planctomycetia bacterium]|nr:hypothetical protein [Planctomycetia bacterium]